MFRFFTTTTLLLVMHTASASPCTELASAWCSSEQCIAKYCGEPEVSESVAPAPDLAAPVPDTATSVAPALDGVTLEQATPALDVEAPSSETYEQDGKAFTIKGFKKTRFGVLKIVEEEDSGTTDIVLDSKSVLSKSSDCYYSIVDLFQMDNTDVALAHESCFGMSRDLYGYFFITIDGDKNTTISDSFPMAGDSANLVGNKIIIDNINIVDDSEIEDNPSTNIAKNTVGEDILFRKVVYENGKVTIEKSSVNLQDKTKSCQNLYDVYKQYVEEDCGTNNPYDEVCSVGGMATSRGCGEYLDFETKLAKEAKLACKSRRATDFSNFKQKVCGLKVEVNKGLEIAGSDLELSKSFAQCAAQVSVMITIGKNYNAYSAEDINQMKKVMYAYANATVALTNEKEGRSKIETAVGLEEAVAAFRTRDGNVAPYFKSASLNVKKCSSLFKMNNKKIMGKLKQSK